MKGLLFIAAVSLLKPGIVTDVFGVVVLVAIYFIQKARRKRTFLHNMKYYFKD